MSVARFSEDDRDVLGGRLRVLANRMGFRSVNDLSRAAGLGESTANSLAERSASTRVVSAGDMESFVKLSDFSGCQLKWLTTGKGEAFPGEPPDPIDQALEGREDLPLYFARALRAHAREAAPPWGLETWRRVVQGILDALSQDDSTHDACRHHTPTPRQSRASDRPQGAQGGAIHRKAGPR